MKLLVINPPNEPFSERSLLIEPIDVLGVATYAKSIGNDVKLVDMDVKQQTPESLEETLKDFRPFLTVIPFDYHIPLHTSKAVDGINRISSLAKEYGSKVAVAGKTSKHYPDLFLNGGADVVINGEIELTLSDLVHLSLWNPSELMKIQGITYANNGETISTKPRRTRINLDSLPIPERELVDLSDYIDVRTILTSRGCMGRCSFCPTPNYWGNWRARSPRNVVDEIEELVTKSGAKKILFLDDNATVNKDRMKQISRGIMDRGIDVTLGCLGTISAYDRETIGLMQVAGFRWIHYGAESGNSAILKANGKNITPEQIKKAVKETKDAGLRVRTSWIFDLPGTNEDTLQETIDLILETEPHEIRAHYLALRAGTDMYKQAAEGQVLPSQYIHTKEPMLSLSGYNQHKITEKVRELKEELQNKGYLVIDDVTAWRDIDKLRDQDPQLRFISFCPSKYGLNWEQK
ncbi:MAG: B12-binding domain-containing radical SAM protein [Candidatus Woesearchaeota archaeon]